MTVRWARSGPRGAAAAVVSAAAAIAVAGLAGTAVAFGVALDVGYADHDGLVATGRAAAVLIPVAVGLHQWRSRAPQRFAPLLVLAGLLMVLVSLAESHTPVLYSAARVGAWISEYLVIVATIIRYSAIHPNTRPVL